MTYRFIAGICAAILFAAVVAQAADWTMAGSGDTVSTDAAFVFNDSGTTTGDVTIESDSNTQQLWVDASAECVGVNDSDCSASEMEITADTNNVGLTVTGVSGYQTLIVKGGGGGNIAEFKDSGGNSVLVYQGNGNYIQTVSAGQDYSMIFRDADVNHGFTSIATATTGLVIQRAHPTVGGIEISGFGANGSTTPFVLKSHVNTTGSTTAPTYKVHGYKSDGAGSVATLGTTDEVFHILNNATILALMEGDGKMSIGNGADTSPDGQLDIEAATGNVGLVVTGNGTQGIVLFEDTGGTDRMALAADGGLFLYDLLTADPGAGTDGVLHYDGATEEIYTEVAQYGELYETGGSTAITITTAGTYYPWASTTAGSSSGMTVSTTTDDITVAVAGTYQLQASCSFTATANATVKGRIFEEGSGQTNCTFSRKISTGGDIGAASINCLVASAVNDSYTLQFTSTTNGDTVTPVECNLSAHKL